MFRTMLVNMLALHVILAFLLVDYYVLTEYFPWVPSYALSTLRHVPLWGIRTSTRSAFALFEKVFLLTFLAPIMVAVGLTCLLDSSNSTSVPLCMQGILDVLNTTASVT